MTHDRVPISTQVSNNSSTSHATALWWPDVGPCYEDIRGCLGFHCKLLIGGRDQPAMACKQLDHDIPRDGDPCFFLGDLYAAPNPTPALVGVLAGPVV